MRIVKRWKTRKETTDAQIKEFADIIEKISGASSISGLLEVAEIDGELTFVNGGKKPVADEQLKELLIKLQEICEPVFDEEFEELLVRRPKTLPLKALQPLLMAAALAQPSMERRPRKQLNIDPWRVRRDRQEKKRQERRERQEAKVAKRTKKYR